MLAKLAANLSYTSPVNFVSRFFSPFTDGSFNRCHQRRLLEMQADS